MLLIQPLLSTNCKIYLGKSHLLSLLIFFSSSFALEKRDSRSGQAEIIGRFIIVVYLKFMRVQHQLAGRHLIFIDKFLNKNSYKL